MCIVCWERDGSPTVDNEKVRAAASLIQKVYDHDELAGNLYTQFENWNLEDQWLEPDAKDAPSERVCRAYLRTMTQQERSSAMALFEEFWGVEK